MKGLVAMQLTSLLLPTSAFKGSLLFESLYSFSYQDITFSAVNVHVYVSNSFRDSGVIDLRTDLLPSDAVTLKFSPAKIISLVTPYSYVTSEDASASIVYSVDSMRTHKIASLLLMHNSSDPEWTLTIKEVGKIDTLNAFNKSVNVQWQDANTIVLRSNVYPDRSKCYVHGISYNETELVTFRHETLLDGDVDDINVDLFDEYVYSNTLGQLVFRMVNSHAVRLDFVDSGLYRLFANASVVQDTAALFSTSDCDLNSSQSAPFFQTSDVHVSRTHIVSMNHSTDAHVSLQDGGLYMIEVQTTFSMQCADLLSGVSDIVPYASVLDIFHAQLGEYIVTQSRNHKDSTLNRCEYRIVTDYMNKRDATMAYFYLQRLLPVDASQSANMVTLHTVPFHNKVVTVEQLTNGLQVQTGTCQYETVVHASLVD